MVCEAVTNALKHAGAATIEVDVRLDGGCARVSVTDDGSGGADLRAGSGLRGLYERVQAVGGRLVVGDRRPSGTALEATLPCGS
ncbi:sensor histidine kinase [Nonomuraea rubra]|uniref:sensor histidine kinase n=1 Tax=Nonomuraea rubra TaxID=46180 RepID=UPI003615B041